MTQDHLSAKNLSVRFGGIQALDDVSLGVAPGEVVGVIGPNGAGKTTVFNAICGLVPRQGGSIQWRGDDFEPRPDRLARAGIARTLQGVGVFSSLSVLENVLVGADLRHRTSFLATLIGMPSSGRSERDATVVALDVLDRLGIRQFAEARAADLPYPVQKRVSMARALVSDPRMLLLDEPAGGLGAADIESLIQLIREFATTGDRGVMLVEHHMDMVMAVCDRLVVMDFGKVVATGTPSEVRSDPAVAAAYLGISVDDLPTDEHGDRVR